MAPSRELSAPIGRKDEGLNDIAMPMHSQALIPYPAVAPFAATKADPLAAGLDLASVLTGDFKNIKSLLTCSICDQLMYEPWTNACGHTYCYGCLTTWFEVNRRKKSCPECRTAVRHMPAPAFVIRQIVDIFVGRREIMPAEESVEEHHQRRKEEREAVDNDRNSVAGLFKGTFSGSYHRAIIYDEADRVYRCGSCSHEFVPGPRCENCGADFEGEEEALQDDWSDDEDLDINLDEVEMDYEDMDEEDMDDEDAEELEEYTQAFLRRQDFGGNSLHNFISSLPIQPVGEEQYSEQEEDSDAETIGSLDGFVVDEEEDADREEGNSDEEDEEMNGSTPARPMFTHRQRHQAIPISSEDGAEEEVEEEDDDTAPIQARRRNQRNRRPAMSDDDDEDQNDEADEGWALPSDGRRRSRPQVIDSDESDSETTGNSGVSLGRTQHRSDRPTMEDSESDAEPNEYENMENNGFSPLNGGESEDEESHEIGSYGYQSGPEGSGNDTDNTLRVEEQDEESIQWDDEVEDPNSDHEGRPMSRPMAVPDPPRRRRWEQPLPARRGTGGQGGVRMGSGSQPIDLDSDNSSSESEEEEEEEEEEDEDNATRGYSDVAMSTSPSRLAERAGSGDEENLGNALTVRGDEDQSSEDSQQPPRRRRRINRVEPRPMGWYGSGVGGYATAPIPPPALPRHSRVSRSAQSSSSRGAYVVSPSASRSHRRAAQYEYSMTGRLHPMAPERRSRAPPRSYGYDASSYARSRHDEGW